MCGAHRKHEFQEAKMHPGVMCNVQQVLRLFCLSDFVFVVPSENLSKVCQTVSLFIVLEQRGLDWWPCNTKIGLLFQARVRVATSVAWI